MAEIIKFPDSLDRDEMSTEIANQFVLRGVPPGKANKLSSALVGE